MTVDLYFLFKGESSRQGMVRKAPGMLAIVTLGLRRRTRRKFYFMHQNLEKVGFSNTDKVCRTMPFGKGKTTLSLMVMHLIFLLRLLTPGAGLMGANRRIGSRCPIKPAAPWANSASTTMLCIGTEGYNGKVIL